MCAAGETLISMGECGGDVESATPVESRTGGVVVRIRLDVLVTILVVSTVRWFVVAEALRSNDVPR